MSGSGSGESPSKEVAELQKKPAFNIVAYVFNGHGRDINPANPEEVLKPKHVPDTPSEGAPRFKLPENTYYVTVEECGNISVVNTSDILKSFNWRNPAFDKIPSKKDLALMKELKELFGIEDVAKIHIHTSAPGDIGVVPNLFTPISVTHEDKLLIIDAAPGVIKRENLINAEKEGKNVYLTRTYLGQEPSDKEKFNKIKNDFGITGRFDGNIADYYEYSYWPTKAFVKSIYDKHETALRKNKKLTEEAIREKANIATIEELEEETKGRSVEDIIYEIREKVSKETPLVFYNPLCRFIQLPRKKAEREEVEKGINLTQSSSLGYQAQTEETEESETETVPSLTPSSSGETTSSSGSESTTEEESGTETETESEPEKEKTGKTEKPTPPPTRVTRSQTTKNTKPGGRRRTYRRQAVPKHKTYRNKKLKRQTRKRR